MAELEISPEVFTADYVGEPGRRAFYLQSRSDEGVVSLAIEKQQVAILAEELRKLLIGLDAEDTVVSTPPARDPALKIADPVEPQWRVGAMGLAYEGEADRIVLLAQPAEADPDLELEEDGLRFVLRRDQVRAFVLHSAAVVDEGRPTCQLCGLPIDPEGHACPASNGHRALV